LVFGFGFSKLLNATNGQDMENSANYNCIGKNSLVYAHAPPVGTISFTKTSSTKKLSPLINCPQNTTLMTKKHRGRIQAQGNGVEKSVTWSQDEPLSREQGKTLLQQLKSQLSDKEHAERAEQFDQAERYIEGANGIPAPERRTFQNRKTKDVRVDIEVLAGRAFIAVAFLVALYFILN
jgi:hypothetical protein